MQSLGGVPENRSQDEINNCDDDGRDECPDNDGMPDRRPQKTHRRFVIGANHLLDLIEVETKMSLMEETFACTDKRNQ